MWWSTGPHLARRCAEERGDKARHKSMEKKVARSYFALERDTDEFCKVLTSKYGTITRGWRVAMDTDNSGSLDFREFVAALKKIGFTGNYRTLWHNLDTDQSGYIGLPELDPVAAHALDRFRVVLTTRFGSIAKAWSMALDQDHSGMVNVDEFVFSAKELGYCEGEARELFELLQVRPGAHCIALHDVLFLQGWEDTKCCAQKNTRVSLGWVNKDPHLNFGSLEAKPVPSAPSARKSITPLPLSEAHKAEAAAAKAVVLHMDPSLPQAAHAFVRSKPKEKEKRPSSLQGCYTDATGHDGETHLQAFKRHLVHRYGSMINGFEALDFHGNGAMTQAEFQSAVCGTLRYCRAADARRLYEDMCKEKEGQDQPHELINWKDFGINSPEWIRHTMGKRWTSNSGEQRSGASVAPTLFAVPTTERPPRAQSALTKHFNRVKATGKSSKKEQAFGPGTIAWASPRESFKPRMLSAG